MNEKENLLCYFLGSLRDGYTKIYGNDYDIGVTQKDIDWLKILQNVIKELFNKTVNIHKNGEWFKVHVRDKKIFLNLLERNLITLEKQTFWKTPEIIAHNSENVKWYIGGFFDAEGGIGKYNKGNKSYLRLDFYHSWNNENGCPPLEDVKIFLEALGMKCGKVRLRSKKSGNINPRYVLSISNLNSIELFNRLIPFKHPKKSQKLTAMLAEA